MAGRAVWFDFLSGMRLRFNRQADGLAATASDRADAATTPAGGRALRLGLLGFCFALSGAAALVYQVAWQRILAFHTGVGIESVAMITAAFMAGLGLGSQAGARLSSRLCPRRALLGFAALEAGVALFGAFSVWLYYDVLYVKGAPLYASSARAGLLHFAALVVPTTLMGMTLPLLVRATVLRVEGAARTISWLYGINALGASAGAVLAPWILIRHFGIQGAVFAAAGLNVAAAAGALLLALGREPGEDTETPVAEPASKHTGDPEAPAGRRFGLWVGLYLLSGFSALALEIVWFRVIEVGVKSTTFTFGTVLAIYLLGLGLGSMLGGAWSPRLRRPLKAFLACQCLVLIASALAVIMLAELPITTPLYDDLVRYWWRNRPFVLGGGWDGPLFLRLYVLFPAFLFALPTVLMGMSFTILQRAVQDDPRTSGRKVGLLQTANIIGNVAGSLFVGLLSLTVWGTTGTIRFLVALGLLFAAVGVRTYGARGTFGVLGAALVSLTMLVPDQRSLWSRLHGLEDEGLFAEDATGLASVRPWYGGRWELWINGKRHSWFPFGGVHTALGAVPSLVHAAPREIAIVGLGSGDTAWGAGLRDETESITVFEIVAPLPRLLLDLDQRTDFRKLRRFLKDERVHVRLTDGRNALGRDERRYDVIEMDALHVESAYSGNLYSLEFYQLAARRLKPGGVMATWRATPRVEATFSRAFPHVLSFDEGRVLIGSNDPLPIDAEAWKERLLSRRPRRYLGPNVAGDVYRAIVTWKRIESTPASSLESNRDLFPRDEYKTPSTSSPEKLADHLN
jgi:predicted membrane-bound spermidine synthase